MIRSMTGFARFESSQATGVLTWEIKTVNHRFLDIQLRLPDAFRSLEIACRDVIRQHIQRGRVDATLKWQAIQDNQSTLQCDATRVRALLEVAKQIEALSPFTHTPPSLESLLVYPGVITTQELDIATLEPAVLAGIQQTVLLVNEHREREGQALQQAIRERLENMAGLAHEVKARQPELLQKQQAKLLERLAQSQVATDGQRVEQELVFWAQKMDNSEEVDRLLIHLTEIERILQQSTSVGKTLDFMMQELNREANTMASKSIDSQVSKATVDLKVLIEQMREQVQNIE